MKAKTIRDLLIISAICFLGCIFFFIVLTGNTRLYAAGIWNGRVIAFLIIWVLFVYGHYRFAFTDKSPANNWVRYILCTILFLALVFFADIILCRLVNQNFEFLKDENYWGALAKRVIIVLYPSALFYALIMFSIKRSGDEKEVAKKLAESRLHSLRAQIQPHFLFNTLNSIYGTSITEKATRTGFLLEQFSELLRYSTQTNVCPVNLNDEFGFIFNYVELQKSRLTEDDKILLTLPESSSDKYIYPMLLLPFIENAIKFGFTGNESSLVNIHLTEKDGKLIMRLENPVPPQGVTVPGEKLGLSNTKERLDLLYRDRYMLRQTQSEGIFFTDLEISL